MAWFLFSTHKETKVSCIIINNYNNILFFWYIFYVALSCCLGTLDINNNYNNKTAKKKNYNYYHLSDVLSLSLFFHGIFMSLHYVV